MLFQFLFGGGRKRKTSRAARVRKLSNKVAKLRRNASLKAKEEKLRSDLNKLRGY
jgi:uncharacterized protein YlxW (UPF0749 family)